MGFRGDENNIPIQLPAREAEILGLAAKGLTDKQISAELGISRDTVGTYWRRILIRFNASSRTEVVARATENELSGRANAAERENLRLMQEIHERSEQQAKVLAQHNLIVAIQEALLNLVSKNPDYCATCDLLLSELLVIARSEFGFIGELAVDKDGSAVMRNLALSDIAWDEESRVKYATELKSTFQPCNKDNLVGEVITSRRPVFYEERLDGPRREKLPEGHPPMHSFLGIPVLSGENMIGIIGIANRVGGYSEALLADLSPIV